MLDKVLERLAVFTEKAVKIRGKGGLGDGLSGHQAAWPAPSWACSAVFVVPKFKGLFTMLKGKLPPGLTSFVGHRRRDAEQHPDGARLVLGVAVLFWLFKKSAFGTRVLHWLLLHVPVPTISS